MSGELVALDGKFYHISPDGQTTLIPPSQTTPYAVVTFFKPTSSFTVNNVKNYEALVQILNQHITNRNIPYAIKITGDYNSLYLRAARGAKPPYPTFAQLAKKQAYFSLKDVQGSGVGFFSPPFLSKANTPGYHIHFIGQDRKIGGHILKVSIKHAVVEFMPIYQWTIRFPDTPGYANSKDMTKDYSKGLRQAFGAGIQLE